MWEFEQFLLDVNRTADSRKPTNATIDIDSDERPKWASRFEGKVRVADERQQNTGSESQACE